ncbi:hypothetical protein DH2020_017660 [Rehmannia glutinosa]|uniref:Uncharacterized protein n=1 Tax=Rehmannia glutinosa TaxID=99300 RepID=A0ABR0WVS8_REHGL
MEVSTVHSTEDSVEMHMNTEPEQLGIEPELHEEPCFESVKKVSKVLKPNAITTPKGTTTVGASKRKIEGKSGTDSSSNETRSTLTKPTKSSVSRTSGSVPVTRRSSTGGLPEKQPMSITKRQSGGIGSAGKRTSSLASDPLRKSLPDIRSSSVSSAGSKPATRQSISETRKSVPISPVARTPRTPASSDSSKQDSSKKASVRSSQSSVSSGKRISSPSLDSTGSSSSVRKSVAKVSALSSRSPSISSGSKSGSVSTSLDRSSNLPGRRKVGTPESRDSRLIMLPQVEVKAGDDVRLDLRGHKIRSLNGGGLNLSPNLEFVYLRDNLLSTLDGIEVLKRVKVLDLSFNDFKGPGFEPLENCKALQQLYLAGNQITSLKSLPELPNLEFLSVAQNKLKSLSMASQPRLQHLRVEENPILKMSHLEAAAILLVGPTLKKFNDRGKSDSYLSREEIAIAKRYPSHTALCIRGGWDLCRPELAVDSTFKFLLEQWKEKLPSGYLLKKAFVDQPFEEDACCCHFEFVRDVSEGSGSTLDLKYQWFIGGRTASNFTEISGACGEVYFPKHDDIGRILKVECTPVLEDTEYPTIFAISSPVSPGTGIPKVIKIDVRGELVEGNTIKGYAEVAWCGGTPGKGVASWLRRRWNSSPVVIAGAEEEEYQLTLDDVDSCLVYMYTPVTEEGAKGEPQYAITDYVKAAPPSVSNVQITGEAVEGSTIKGIGEYFGGKEGPSTFEWLREDKDTGECTLVLMGTNEYTLTKEDVGRRLAFVYVPVNFEAPPKVTNLKIIGELKEGSKVTVTGIVTGGTEASSRVQWFKTSSSTFEGENGIEALSTSKIAKAFRIPLGAVGKYIVAKFTPMTPDGEAGEPAYVISDTAVERELQTPKKQLQQLRFIISFSKALVEDLSHLFALLMRMEALPPSLNFLSITGDYSEGGVLTASYGYIGGHEGKSIYNWYLHEAETDSGILIPEVTGLQYRIPKDAIGKFISFTCTPVRNDGIVGEPRPCIGQERVRPGSPRVLSLQIIGTAVEGTTLNVEKKYWGGEEGESIYRWFRVVDQTLAYHWHIHSVLVLVKVKGDCLYEWFRVKGDGHKEKLHVGEFLDLTLAEVGDSVELVYTPVRADGLKGCPKTLVSCPVAPGEPQGVELLIPDCCEGQEVVPETRYFGGREGVGKYIWFRTKNKLHGSDLMELSNNYENADIRGQSLTYTPSREDVGSYLALYWLPTRSDGKCGTPLVSICESPVIPALPIVHNVRVTKMSSSTYYGEGDYFGGYEGASLFSWYRESDDGTTVLIGGANSQTYEVSDEDYNCRVLFGIEMLALTGKAVEGEVLTALEVIPKSENQQLVWGKYKKEVRYQWFFSSETGTEKSFEPFPSQRSCSYKVRFEDIGRYIRCECIVTDVFGRSSEPAYAETTSVLPGVPRMDKLEIEGRGFHTNLYAVRGIYSGGKEGKSRIQWLRSMVGSPDLISIPGETGRMYEANVDDVGYRLVAIYTPIRDDGVEGQPVSASTDPIAVEPDVLKEVKQKLDLGSVKFEVPGMGSLERRILEVNRKRIKVVKPGSKTSFPTTEIRGSYAPPFHVELFRNDQHRLRIVVDSENEVDLMVQTRHLRDVIVLVIRGLAQRFNSTSLNTLLKIET